MDVSTRRTACLVPCCTFPITRRKQAPSDSSVREAHIGVVVFRTHRNEWAEAILDVEGVWRCPELPVLNRVLNILHEPKHKTDKTPFGHAELKRVAAWLKGEVEIPRL